MAKSKSGGTRSYIRGKIGADVYSVGKDGKGKRQQVVRSLAEQVANPQTEAQMFGRMVMSTVMQAVSNMKPIIDHSFDGIPAGQPSISEFIRRNYALIKADAEAHPASGNKFGLNKYQEKGCHKGQYIVSKGNVVLPSALAISNNGPQVTITLSSAAHTVGDLKTAIGINNTTDYFTFVAISEDTSSRPNFGFARFRFNPEVSDDTVITADNASTVFVVEANTGVNLYYTASSYTFGIGLSGGSYWDASGAILSVKNADGWQHSTCTLVNGVGTPSYNANTALPTYPQGSARFLNGGDI